MPRHRDTILVKSAGNYVGQPTVPSANAKKRVKSTPINFESPETWITKEHGIIAQKVLAGIAYNLTEPTEEDKDPILDVTELPVAVSLVLEILGIFQNLDDRRYPYSMSEAPVESHSLGSVANVSVQAGLPFQGSETVS
jgi:hypothetical protein